MRSERIRHKAEQFVGVLRRAGVEVPECTLRIAKGIEEAKASVGAVLLESQVVETGSQVTENLRGGRIYTPADHLVGSGFGTKGKLADQPGFRFS